MNLTVCGKSRAEFIRFSGWCVSMFGMDEPFYINLLCLKRYEEFLKFI